MDPKFAPSSFAFFQAVALSSTGRPFSPRSGDDPGSRRAARPLSRDVDHLLHPGADLPRSILELDLVRPINGAGQRRLSANLAQLLLREHTPGAEQRAAWTTKLDARGFIPDQVIRAEVL